MSNIDYKKKYEELQDKCHALQLELEIKEPASQLYIAEKQYSEMLSKKLREEKDKTKELRENWTKLKKFCGENGFSEGWNSKGWDDAISAIVDKMKELEQAAERNKQWYNEKAGECAELKETISNFNYSMDLMKKEVDKLKEENKSIRIKFYNEVTENVAVERIDGKMYCRFDDFKNIMEKIING